MSCNSDKRTDWTNINLDVNIEVQERTDGIDFICSDVMDVQNMIEVYDLYRRTDLMDLMKRPKYDRSIWFVYFQWRNGHSNMVEVYDLYISNLYCRCPKFYPDVNI